MSRITRGGIELRKEDLDLRDVIRTAIESLTPVLDERQSEVHMDLPDEVLPIRGDSARIQQVVVNLLSNAARYSATGCPIHLSTVIEGDSVVLKIKDQGRGISPSMLSAIFELFVQDGQGLERSMGGLGIGLTLVRQIVELHGGTVYAESLGPGMGSTFTVMLPLSAVRPATSFRSTPLPPRTSPEATRFFRGSPRSVRRRTHSSP